MRTVEIQLLDILPTRYKPVVGKISYDDARRMINYGAIESKSFIDGTFSLYLYRMQLLEEVSKVCRIVHLYIESVAATRVDCALYYITIVKKLCRVFKIDFHDIMP
jgi:hypothetical protein